MAEWIKSASSRYIGWQLFRDGRCVGELQRQRVAAWPWYGWLSGDGHKYGPFPSLEHAKKWLAAASAVPGRKAG